MGVKGLWELVKPTGRRVPFASLAHLSVAVDTSIWLNNFIKAMRDRDGRSIPNAHIIGLFYRICKLLFAQVRPVFVFDGATPELKRRTLARRQAQRKKAATHVQRAAKRLMINQLKQQALRMAAQTTSGNPPLSQLEAAATRAAQAAEDRQRQRDRANRGTAQPGTGDTGTSSTLGPAPVTTTPAEREDSESGLASQPEQAAPIDLTSSTSDEEQNEDLNRYNYLPGSQDDGQAKGRPGSLALDLAKGDDGDDDDDGGDQEEARDSQRVGVLNKDEPAINGFLSLVVSVPRNDRFLVSALRTLTLQESLTLMNYLSHWYKRYTNEEAGVTATRGHGQRHPSFFQVLDWATLLIDARFSELILVPECHGFILQLRQLTNANKQMCESVSTLKGFLHELLNGNGVPRAPVADYSLEVFELK
eukprot:TRINITY_DN1748_c0_g1_i1.p1 TRINITY_DN1748_c0_g1~~TRINITY_DN1748_c0_g1_i1.p1  ORF type:complete len:419 (+),score=90.42 TRINITY_DN1748_c0_g1_i1:36-1292(+)